MIINQVVTSFLWNDQKILILKRSQKVGSQRGKWAGVSGYLEDNEPLKQAYQEIFEETSLGENDIILMKEGSYLDFPSITSDTTIWRVFPFSFKVVNPDKIVLDWEHDEMKWIDPQRLKDYDIIRGMEEVLHRVF